VTTSNNELMPKAASFQLCKNRKGRRTSFMIILAILQELSVSNLFTKDNSMAQLKKPKSKSNKKQISREVQFLSMISILSKC